MKADGLKIFDIWSLWRRMFCVSWYIILLFLKYLQTIWFIFYIKYAQNLEKLWDLFFWTQCGTKLRLDAAQTKTTLKTHFRSFTTKHEASNINEMPKLKRKYLGNGFISHKGFLLDKTCTTPTLFRSLKLNIVPLTHFSLMLSWISYKIHSFNMQCKSKDWFLYKM